MVGFLADIPLNKLQNDTFRNFLKKYTIEKIPEQTVLRRHYVPEIYQRVLNKIRAKVGNNYIWVSLDESTDVEQRAVANFIIGILGVEEEVGTSYLLNMAVLEATNHRTIAAFFNDSLQVLWPQS